MGKKVVLLLGAGFAIPFGAPSCNDIRDAFENDVDYGEIAKNIFAKLDEYYGGEGMANFETFLAAVESMAYYVFSKTNPGKPVKISNLMPSIYDLNSDLNQKLNQLAQNKYHDDGEDALRDFMWDLFAHFIQIVIDKIAVYDKDEIPQTEIREKFKKYIESLTKKYDQVKIYTTNYDRLIPQMLSSNGLYEALNSQKYIEYNVSKFIESKLSFFNLHGSIYWNLEKNKIKTEDNPYNTMRIEDYSKKILVLGGNPSEPIMFCPIVAGYSKTQRAFSTPFDLGFTVFACDCNTCEKIITIGFSFNDSHIKSIMSDFGSQVKNILEITYDSKKNLREADGNRKIYNGGLTQFLTSEIDWN
jgi:hypothetical protein